MVRYQEGYMDSAAIIDFRIADVSFKNICKDQETEKMFLFS